MNSILETGRNRTKCQKFTPIALVNTMLDLVDYKTNLIGKTVLENSFGSGNILKAVVVRYIESAIGEGVNRKCIADGLSRDIYGIELDKVLYRKCVSDLNAILKSYGIPAVQWRLFNKNALLMNLEMRFDYVIGNPPYISYKEMDGKSRTILKGLFETCSVGKFDYCYAFIELGIRCLKNTGKLVSVLFIFTLPDEVKGHNNNSITYVRMRNGISFLQVVAGVLSLAIYGMSYLYSFPNRVHKSFRRDTPL